MSTNATDHPWRTSLAWSAVFRVAGLSITGFLSWLWFSSADGPAWRAVSLVAVLALAALAGVAWYLPRARTETRWRAALDRYAERQQAKLAFRPVLEEGRRHDGLAALARPARSAAGD